MKKHNLSFLNSSKNDLTSILSWINKKCHCYQCKKYLIYKNLFQLNEPQNLDLKFSKIKLTSKMKSHIINELHYILLKKKIFKLSHNINK